MGPTSEARMNFETLRFLRQYVNIEIAFNSVDLVFEKVGFGGGRLFGR